MAGGILNSVLDLLDRTQGFNTLVQQPGMDTGMAALAQRNPLAFQGLWQRNIFENQLADWQKRNPGGDFNKFLYDISGPGQEQAYGYKPVPGFKSNTGAEAPGLQHGGQIIPPIGGAMDFSTIGPGVAPPAGAQPQPSQQPAAQSYPGLSPGENKAVQFKGAIAQEEAKAKAAGALQPGFPAALVKAHQAISVLDDIEHDPRLESVTGRVAGGLPAKYSVAPDLVNSIDSANNILLNDALTSARNITGRSVSAGALKEIRPYDLNASRLGGADALRADIRRAKKQIQDETDAAWIGSNSPAEYKPIWGKSVEPTQPPQPNDRHIQYLRANPGSAADFDKKFGKGAAQKVLGNAQSL